MIRLRLISLLLVEKCATITELVRFPFLLFPTNAENWKLFFSQTSTVFCKCTTGRQKTSKFWGFKKTQNFQIFLRDPCCQFNVGNKNPNFTNYVAIHNKKLYFKAFFPHLNFFTVKLCRIFSADVSFLSLFPDLGDTLPSVYWCPSVGIKFDSYLACNSQSLILQARQNFRIILITYY